MNWRSCAAAQFPEADSWESTAARWFHLNTIPVVATIRWRACGGPYLFEHGRSPAGHTSHRPGTQGGARRQAELASLGSPVRARPSPDCHVAGLLTTGRDWRPPSKRTRRAPVVAAIAGNRGSPCH